MHSKKLYQLIFFVTNRCNSRCRHCFNWKNLNTATDLDLGVIEELSKKLPLIKHLLLSGGEPFLRPDLAELVALFVNHNKIETISIPTNGLLTEEILRSLKKILAIKEIESVNINFSLDGLGEVHNNIRGVENNFNITLNTINEVAKLKQDYPRLNILVNSVITQENKESLLELNDLISTHNKVSGHFFEIIRPMSPGDLGELNIPFDFYGTLLDKQYNYFKNEIQNIHPIKRVVKKIFFLGKLSFFYHIQYQNYFQKKNWPMNCSAGKNVVVMNDKGLLSPCELRSKTFSLKDYSSFQELIDTSSYLKELAAIQKEKCFCTHICFIDSSINYYPIKKYFYFLVYGLINYLRYEIIGYHPKL